MPLDPQALLGLSTDSEVEWGPHATALYALGVGAGRDPLDTAELAYVAGEPLKALPSMMASMLVGRGVAAKQMGIKFRSVVHTAQRVVVPGPLADRGRAKVFTQIADVYDDGAERGATIISRSTVVDVATEVEIAVCHSEIRARANGGFGGQPSPRRSFPNLSRDPDGFVEYDVRPDQALLFRLSGDTNPLHSDPEAAKAAGFPKPILQGLCTYGMACRAVQEFGGGQDSGLDLAARFAAPVFPGERFQVRLWRHEGEILFEGYVPDRDTLVLRAGRAKILRENGEGKRCPA